MKKILLSAVFCALSVLGFAENKTYTDDLVVTINEVSTPAQKSDIQVEFLENNQCNLSLKNFCLGMGEDVLYVGNIVLNDIELTETEGYKTFEVEQTIHITPGDLPGTSDTDWIGPGLQNVPIKMTGKINEEKLYCLIDIDMMSSLGQMIKVTFGSDITTSVHHITAENSKVNIYNITGVCIAKNINAAHAFDNLPKGIYIVNGKKIIKK
jgi:hypothetical protein